MAEPTQQARPVMRAAASFQNHLRGFLLGEKGFHLAAFELASQHGTFLLIDPMKREDVFGRVNRDALEFHLDGPWLVTDNSTLARDAVGPSTPTGLIERNL